MVTPYYRSDRVALYLGDCRKVLADLDPLDAGLMVADPPYGVNWYSHGWRKEPFDRMAGDDGSVDWPAVLGDIVRRHLRNHRHVYVFGYREEQLREPLLLGSAAGLIWDKGILGGGDISSCWGPSHEPITFGTYSSRPSGRKAGNGRLAARMRRGSVLHHQRPNAGSTGLHPTRKPVSLIRELIESSSLPGDLVIDPTVGSGSTAVAAVIEGRRAVGVEQDDRYLSIAVDRVREAERLAKLAEAC